MKQLKWAGMTLAVCACAGLAIFSMRQSGGSVSRFIAGATSGETTQRGTLHVPADLSIRNPQPFAMDAAIARRAVRDGVLDVELADGTRYPVRIERQYTDETGHWNVVGRAQTRVGPQAMVLTFGPDAVFGTLPIPDGHLLTMATGPGGKVTIARAGGLLPEGRTAATATNDVIVPPRKPLIAVPPRPVVTQQDIDTAMQSKSSQPRSPTSPAKPFIRTAAAPVAAAAAPQTIQVDVLAYYSPDLVTLRGSTSAAQTEVANLFAIARQSHLDSGTRVRLNVAKMALLNVSTTDYNNNLLYQMQGNAVPGADLEAARDAWGADLVTLIRPAHDNDGSCGVAFLAGAELNGTNVSAAWGYSVVNVAPCGPHVLAHELGHSMGSMHNREEATAYEGDLSHGAFMDSFGYRKPGVFATIMAYPLGDPWVGYFSDPTSTRCLANACGVANHANNVRSLDTMAPAIAAFRGPKDTLSIADTIVLEPTLQQTLAVVPIRLSAPAPAGGFSVDVTITGGTATFGTDYSLLPGAGMSVEFVEGMREGWFFFYIEPDADVEADETVTLHIASTGATVFDADATITIANDDPRPRIEGRLVFDPGVPVPTEPVDVVLTGLNDDINTLWFRLQPPDFAYSLPMRFGGPLVVEGMTTDEYVIRRKRFNEVIEDTAFDLRAERGVIVSGQVRAAAGMTMPDADVPLTIVDGMVNHRVEHTVMVSPPEFAYRWRIPKNTDIFFKTSELAPFAPYYMFLWGVGSDTTFDVTLSSLPTARICCGDWHMEAPGYDYQGYLVAAVYLSAPAPTGGATFRYRLVDGTAKAGEDYVADSGTLVIPEGQAFGYLTYPNIKGDDVREFSEYFDLVVDEVTGAQMPVSTVRFWIDEQELHTAGGHQKDKIN